MYAPPILRVTVPFTETRAACPDNEITVCVPLMVQQHSAKALSRHSSAENLMQEHSNHTSEISYITVVSLMHTGKDEFTEGSIKPYSFLQIQNYDLFRSQSHRSFCHNE